MNKQLFLQQLQALIEDENDHYALMSNISAFLNEILNDINWVGFYIIKDNELVLGPFQGKVACYRIGIDKGVCGKAVSTDSVLRIKNVHDFDGHIACDSASMSEIVLPIHIDDHIYGVLDIDSPIIDRFSKDDELFLKDVIKIIEKRFSE